MGAVDVRVTGEPADVARAVEEVSAVLHVVRESPPRSCRRRAGGVMVYLACAVDGTGDRAVEEDGR